MSVLQIPTLVMKMQFAQTLMVLQPVLVNRDSLEMEQFVKVYGMNERPSTVRINCVLRSFLPVSCLLFATLT